MAEKYSFVLPRHPLAEASTNFSEAIRDWLSDPGYVERLRQAGEEPSAILDDITPPEEEVPLPSPQAAAPPGTFFRNLPRRFLD